MKALILCGSGNREGFTNAMCQGAERALSSDGWDVDVLRPYDMDVRHCNGCLGCRKDGRCVIDDDMGEVYSATVGMEWAGELCLGGTDSGDTAYYERKAGEFTAGISSIRTGTRRPPCPPYQGTGNRDSTGWSCNGRT